MPRIHSFVPLFFAASLAAAQTAPNTYQQPGATVNPAIADPTAAMAPPAFVPGQPATAPRGPVRISGGVMAGYLVHHVMPTYPPKAVAARVSSVVVLAVTISKAGTVKNVAVISGAPVMADATIHAVRQWTYRPYLLNGQPTEVSTTVTCSAQFNNGATAMPQ